MATETKKTESPPYIAFSTFLSFIKGLATTGVPSRIDKSLLRNMSGGNQSALLAALKWFDLIDEAGHHGPPLEQLVSAGDGLGFVLKSMMPKAYAFMADGSIDIGRATGSQLEEKFRAYGVSGSTIVKAMAFFIAACKEAEIPLSAHIKLPKVNRSANAVRKKARPQSAVEQEEEEEEERDDGRTDHHPFIQGLLEKLPEPDAEWSMEARGRWLTTAANIFSLMYAAPAGADGKYIEVLVKEV
jgi:hypothetical protein